MLQIEPPRILVTLVCILIFPSWCTSQIIHVKQGGTGIYGLSWTDAFGDLQQAIDSAYVGQTIWVAEGIYNPSRGVDADSSGEVEIKERTFLVQKDIILLGGFSGFETTEDDRNPDKHVVWLSGDLAGEQDSSDYVYHVLTIDGRSGVGHVSDQFLIDGFHITYGYANGTHHLNQIGSAVFLRGAGEESHLKPVISNCVIKHSYSTYGGTMYMDARFGDLSATVSNCHFKHNRTYSGAGVMINGSEGTCNVRIEQCKFTDNIASYAAGAIFNFNYQGQCSLEIINCLFERNESEYGGAVYNYAQRGMQRMMVSGSQFSHNKAHQYGGGIFNYGFESDHESILVNNTFYHNIGWYEGGAIKNWNTRTTAYNCIFWENGDEIFNKPNTITEIHHSIFQDHSPGNGNVTLPEGVSGVGNLDLDPIFIDDVNYNLRLAVNSPAIDRADGASAGLYLSTHDMDGYDRTNGLLDIGAFENPLLHCPPSMVLDEYYSPYTGTIEAENLLVLGGRASIQAGQVLTLRAKSIELDSGIEVSLGTVVSLIPEGCTTPR